MNERLYRLLPAIHRSRDREVGEPLRALLAVVQAQVDALDADIRGLYDNWFIETCDEWVVPYLADLLGVRGLSTQASIVFSQRARVANTLRYRRRKGTLGALESLIRDVTGWPARAVEYSDLVGVTQHVEHPRVQAGGSLDVRILADPNVIGRGFDTIARTVHVGRIERREGRHNLGNVGVFLWRLASHRISNSPAGVIGDPEDGRCTFDPFGRDISLYTRMDVSTDGERTSDVRAAEAHVPGPIRRGALAADLNDHRAQLSAISADNTRYYGPERSLWIRIAGEPVRARDLIAADLSEWAEPEPDRVAVDVGSGRLLIGADLRVTMPGEAVYVDYHYGFSSNLGGGTYDRRASLSLSESQPWRLVVGPGGSVLTLADALQQWRQDGAPHGVIRILDSGLYHEALSLELPAGSRLTIEAADGARPCIRIQGELLISGPADPDRATVRLSGLSMEAVVRVQGAADIEVVHCTMVHGDASDAEHPVFVSQGDSERSSVTIEYSVLGPLSLDAGCGSLEVSDSIIGAALASSSPVVALSAQGALAGPVTSLKRCTILGRIELWTLVLASECVFTDSVTVERQQAGCVRYSYIPDGSRTPGRFRCQPELAVAEAERAVEPPSAGQLSLLKRRLIPRLTSVHFGEPGFCQLSEQCAIELRVGAEDGSEMGAFQHLQQSRRAANLRLVLREYLPATLAVGVFPVT